MKLKVFLKGLMLIPRKILSAPIKFYRKYLSRLKSAPSCRFTPTCSEYALEAISEWGAFIGTFLALRRVFRCNPFGGCGHDPVPKRKKKTDKSVTPHTEEYAKMSRSPSADENLTDL